MNRLFAATSLIALISAPAVAQDSPGALADAFVAAVEAEDSTALAALFTADAVSYSPGSHAVTGSAAIGADWQAFFDAFEIGELTLAEAGHVGGDATASAWGTWSMTVTPDGADEAMVMTGRYMDVSTATDDGWRYMADHASVSPPVAAPEPAAEPEAAPDAEPAAAPDVEAEVEPAAVVEPVAAPVVDAVTPESAPVAEAAEEAAEIVAPEPEAAAAEEPAPEAEPEADMAPDADAAEDDVANENDSSDE